MQRHDVLNGSVDNFHFGHALVPVADTRNVAAKSVEGLIHCLDSSPLPGVALLDELQVDHALIRGH